MDLMSGFIVAVLSDGESMEFLLFHYLGRRLGDVAWDLQWFILWKTAWNKGHG